MKWFVLLFRFVNYYLQIVLTTDIHVCKHECKNVQIDASFQLTINYIAQIHQLLLLICRPCVLSTYMKFRVVFVCMLCQRENA